MEKLFRDKTLEKELKNIRRDYGQKISQAWERFQAYFHNPDRQEEILRAKEKEFQDSFLRALFVDIFDYPMYGDKGGKWLLRREKNNVTDAKSADAVILRYPCGTQIHVVIELKDTKTKDLDKKPSEKEVSPVVQAFGYKNNQKGVRYVIVSNFKLLRFYIDDATAYEEFDLFDLEKREFERLYLCLAQETLLKDIPLQVRDESSREESDVTKKLYKDYELFRSELFQNIVINNPEYDEKTLDQKTQKLLDRLIFTFFCEDKGLLPANSITKIIEQNENGFVDKPLSDDFRDFFKCVDKGNSKIGISGFNGGLFAPDEILDKLKIDDALLKKHTKHISKEYDFDSDVDVNILGHIFEHTLAERDKLENGGGVENSTKAKSSKSSKRKDDGVFYTPSYITRYIVETTLGALCEEKRQKLGIDDETYSEDPGSKQKRDDLQRRLDDYRNWLLELKICDPACGSGAFLVAALKYLIEEHSKIDLWSASIKNKKGETQALVFQDIDLQILENNLYGVDINKESVEIARLSLWLHTCKKGRKLNDLSNNIKCGNSLIAEQFDWGKEFPFGGFDVVIGNPPYVQLQKKSLKQYHYENCGFETFHGQGDLYCLFVEMGHNLLKSGGFLSYIMPNKWLINNYGSPLRRFLVNKGGLLRLLDFGDVRFFEDATNNCCIFTLRHPEPGTPGTGEIEALAIDQRSYDDKFSNDFPTAVANCHPISITQFGENIPWIITPPEQQSHQKILSKMSQGDLRLKDLPITISYGVKTGKIGAFIIKNQKKEELVKQDPNSMQLLSKVISGRDVTLRGGWNGDWLITTFPAKNVDIDQFPAIKDFLLDFGKDRLEQIGTDKGGRKKTSYKWFETQDVIDYYKKFSEPKIFYLDITNKFPFSYDERGFFVTDRCWILTANDNSISLHALTALLNSTATKLWIWHNCPDEQGASRKVCKKYFENFPVPPIERITQLEEPGRRYIALNSELRKQRENFRDMLKANFTLTKPEKFISIDDYGFDDFLMELKKQKISLKPINQAEWQEAFNNNQKKCQEITKEIRETDAEIEKIVAELYGFTSEEASVLRTWWAERIRQMLRCPSE
ncbi:MAG: Eco57I restriction-modification methylase domain-containing protein [Thermoguttaceae bacterium]|nr:Eco57I restriction-modification methylase domain-containing protein [Thermoguttaceae bacterium]